MRTVHKFEIPVVDHPTVPMPKDAVLLHVDQQVGSRVADLQVWALVDTDAELEHRQFRVVGTGHDLTGETIGTHVGSVLSLGGTLVWHVFDMGAS
jgi:hypothetical protein